MNTEKEIIWFIAEQVNVESSEGVVWGYYYSEEETASIPTEIPNRYIGIDLKFHLNNSGPNLTPLTVYQTKEEALNALQKKEKQPNKLRIKKEKWSEFQERSIAFGFQLNNCNNGYEKKFYENKEFLNDYVLLNVWTHNQEITIETSNSRYSGFEIDGTVLNIIYDLIAEGFVEKTS